jgi:hypothetical protein
MNRASRPACELSHNINETYQYILKENCINTQTNNLLHTEGSQSEDHIESFQYTKYTTSSSYEKLEFLESSKLSES